MQIFPTRIFNVTAWRHSRLLAHWLMTLVAGAEGELPGNCSVSYLSFVYGRSLWAELNGGENSIHWKPNMLPLFSIMTLWRGTMLHGDTVPRSKVASSGPTLILHLNDNILLLFKIFIFTSRYLFIFTIFFVWNMGGFYKQRCTHILWRGI